MTYADRQQAGTVLAERLHRYAGRGDVVVLGLVRGGVPVAARVAQALGAPLRPESAHCLFVAVAMDTGWFRHQNTTPRTLELAARLVEAGARPTAAYEALFEQSSLGRLKLTGLVLGRLKV